MPRAAPSDATSWENIAFDTWCQRSSARPRISTLPKTIPGTDGQKMSKSYHNTIELFDPSAKKKVMGIVTDSTPMEDPKEPEGNSIYELYRLFATPAEAAEMAAAFRAGGYGYGSAKKALLAAYHRLFDPFAARRAELAKDPDALEDILREGAKKARAAAAVQMEKVRAAVGL